jgi:MATE family multidrug resistance protein
MLAFITLLLLGYPFYVDNIIYRFLGEGALTLPSAFIETCYFALLFSLIYIFIDGLRYVYTGVLTAAGDTLFLLLANFVGIWLFLVIPTYLFVVILEVSLLQSLTVAVSFSLMMLLAFLLRYRFGGWHERQII